MHFCTTYVKERTVLLISALHNDEKTYLVTRDTLKLEVHMFCNSTKGDVDSAINVRRLEYSNKYASVAMVMSVMSYSVTNVATTNTIMDIKGSFGGEGNL